LLNLLPTRKGQEVRLSSPLLPLRRFHRHQRSAFNQLASAKLPIFLLNATSLASLTGPVQEFVE
jgi:hypothetical protein